MLNHWWKAWLGWLVSSCIADVWMLRYCWHLVRSLDYMALSSREGASGAIGYFKIVICKVFRECACKVSEMVIDPMLIVNPGWIIVVLVWEIWFVYNVRNMLLQYCGGVWKAARNAEELLDVNRTVIPWFKSLLYRQGRHWQECSMDLYNVFQVVKLVRDISTSTQACQSAMYFSPFLYIRSLDSNWHHENLPTSF